MELSVTVRGLRGGEDLTFSIELRLTRRRKEVRGVDPWRYSFTCNDLCEWVATQPFGDQGQATLAFNKLFEAVQAGKFRLGVKCSYLECRGKTCKGVHRINAEDFWDLTRDQLDSIAGIGRRDRYLILTSYHAYWKLVVGRAVA